MNLTALQKLLPGGIALLGLLGDTQKEWLLANSESFAPFLNTTEGKDALLVFLKSYYDFCSK